MCCYAPLLA
ncbi:hypothetical protein LINPERPRIM_LOCUS23071 [Linum perenne]